MPSLAGARFFLPFILFSLTRPDSNNATTTSAPALSNDDGSRDRPQSQPSPIMMSTCYHWRVSIFFTRYTSFGLESEEVSHPCYLLAIFHYRSAYRHVGLVFNHVDQKGIPISGDIACSLYYIIFAFPEMLSHLSAW